MRINENWAVSTARIQQFLNEQEDISSHGGAYRFKDCAITLTPDVGNIGAITINRTQVCFEGPEEHIKVIYKRFFLRFLSAGG